MCGNCDKHKKISEGIKKGLCGDKKKYKISEPVAETVRKGIKFAEESGEGVWRTINGSPVFIKEGQSVEEAVAAKAALRGGTPKPTTFFRGGGTGSMPKGTAADVLKYEREELGNADVKVEKGVDPTKVSTKNLVWLTTTKNAAREYGKAEKVELTNYKIIARDSQGGVLVEKL